MAVKSDINFIYNKYYSDNLPLRRIVRIHSEQVANKALDICMKKNLLLEPDDVYIAAMLHDIGVVKCWAPDIYSRGSLPYLQHGIEGKKILENNGYSQYSSICSTHTGAGISSKEIRQNHLPLPEKDFLPQTLLEKLICYADKFYSKSHDLTREKTVQQVLIQIKKFGSDSYKRFLELHSLFGPN